ncbi:hypothetical protein GW17_00033867 [Ensete ventricosum]|nr:hypothetical protein GW17_00033867 [Ensete ventricosum]
MSFRDLALWRLRLKWGLPVQGYKRLRLRKCHRGSRFVSYRMSAVRPLTPPCLCQAGFPMSGRPRWRASCPRARGRGSQVGRFHEGLQSWHLAVVNECGEFFRVVEHTNRLSGDHIPETVEVIPVSDAIEGTFSTTTESRRSRIRPVPPHVSIGSAEIRYGLCVDALVDHAWWEGVVFDHDEGFQLRRVLFPDLGDEAILTIDRLRLTQDWDEASGHWKPRGRWLFLQLLQNFDCAGSLPVSIRQIWCNLRDTHVFQDKIKRWAFGTKDIWEKVVSELIEEVWSAVNSISVSDVISEELVTDGMASVNVCTSMEDVICPEGADLGLVANGTESTDNNCSSGLNTIDDCALISGAQSPCQLKYASESSSQAVLVVDSTEVSGADGFLQSCDSIQASMKPGACSKALQDFIQVCRNKFCPIDLKKKLCVLRQLARSHLMAAGWKFIKDVKGRKYYVSPLGKRFGSLVTACEAWKTVEENSDTTTDCTFVTENHAAEVRGTFSNLTSMHSKAENIPSCSAANNWKPLKLDASYCPEVVEVYASKMRGGNSRLKSLAELDCKSLSEKVKKHLVALGWTVEFRDDAILRFRFSSPQGRIYYSLIKACSDLLHQKVDEECEYSDDSEYDRSGCSTKRLHSIVDYHEECSGRNFNCADSGKKKVEFRTDEDIEPEYLPEAITEYEGFMDLQDVPEGKWFCPSCRCGICDHSECNHDAEQFTKTTMFSCDQCEGEYHEGCLKGERLQQLGSCSNWFCSKKCLKVHLNKRIESFLALDLLCLHFLLNIMNPLRAQGRENAHNRATTMSTSERRCRLPTAHHALGLRGQLSLPPHMDGNISTPTPTPTRYWRLFNNPGLSFPRTSIRQSVVSAEAFLSLTHQVQALAGMMQTIIPQLAQPDEIDPTTVACGLTNSLYYATGPSLGWPTA